MSGSHEAWSSNERRHGAGPIEPPGRADVPALVGDAGDAGARRRLAKAGR